MEKLLNTKKLSRAEMKAITGGTEAKICWTEGDAGCSRSCQGPDGQGSGYCGPNGDCYCDR